MADFGDRAQSLQEQQLEDALAARGIRPRVTEIPAPHYDDETSPAERRDDKGER